MKFGFTAENRRAEAHWEILSSLGGGGTPNVEAPLLVRKAPRSPTDLTLGAPAHQSYFSRFAFQGGQTLYPCHPSKS
jgi:hypothetical protein